ncbi:winged helix-turn-helix domain-containing protein, partial [Brucella melitensis]|uniref:winged helix-turn-helix domain-containing protein n=1 Tax=Brucella melitensis TaxID=29459 RepID=UPI00112FBE42
SASTAARAVAPTPRPQLTAPDRALGDPTSARPITRLRRTIEQDPATPVWLQNVRGIGYKLTIE